MHPAVVLTFNCCPNYLLTVEGGAVSWLEENPEMLLQLSLNLEFVVGPVIIKHKPWLSRFIGVPLGGG